MQQDMQLQKQTKSISMYDNQIKGHSEGDWLIAYVGIANVSTFSSVNEFYSYGYVP